MKQGLTIRKLKEILREAEISNDLDPDHRVYISRNGVALEVEVATSDLCRLPDGRETIFYGLIFREAGESIRAPKGVLR